MCSGPWVSPAQGHEQMSLARAETPQRASEASPSEEVIVCDSTGDTQLYSLKFLHLTKHWFETKQNKTPSFPVIKHPVIITAQYLVLFFFFWYVCILHPELPIFPQCFSA